MSGRAYYNENDPGAAAWLRELIKAGLIAAGDVDERSIADVQGSDLTGYTQCHFFAGIGGWSLALRLAGWADDRECWTGSCPCPPFSAAGKKKACPECQSRSLLPNPYRTGVFACCDCGHEWPADARHLWPEFHRLIAECRPPVVFGEQVAGADGLVWLAGVRATLEILGYGVGAADLCAAGVAAPHIRQRLFWVADAEVGRGLPRQCGGSLGPPAAGEGEIRPWRVRVEQRPAVDAEPERGGGAGFWSAFDLIPCRDGKARRVEPGSFPLADGFPCRVGLLRGYGNAIVPQVAAQFIRAFEEARAVA